MQRSKLTSLDVLNSLVDVNNCRISAYEYAARETESSTLRSLFTRLAETSRACRNEIAREIERLSGGRMVPDAHDERLCGPWYNVKTAGKNRRAMIDACEMGEDQTENVYKEALEKIDLEDTEQRLLVRNQYILIKSDHERIKNLRRALLEFN